MKKGEGESFPLFFLNRKNKNNLIFESAPIIKDYCLSNLALFVVRKNMNCAKGERCGK